MVMPSVTLRPSDPPNEPSNGPVEPLILDAQVQGNTFSVTLAGSTYEGTFVFTGPGSGWLALGPESGGRILPFHLLREGNRLTVWISGQLVRLERIPPGMRRSAASIKPNGANSGDIRAPLPGIVLKVPVQAGDRVAINAPLVILESMKMETTLSAPLEAVIQEVLCAEGQMVEKGALLIKLA
jgi:multidrug efflux pump subunit AcrA (membrane-fusion protein)